MTHASRILGHRYFAVDIFSHGDAAVKAVWSFGVAAAAAHLGDL
jgi:hypothetical protein